MSGILVPPRQSLGSQIMRSVLFGGLRYVVLLPIPFVMTPLVLKKIGAAGYGTWAVFLAINGLTSLADLGLMGTLSKFVAEYHARRDHDALSRMLSSGLALFLILGLLVTTGLWFASPLLVTRVFHGSRVPNAELVTLSRYYLIVIASNILIQLFASITTGLQRLDLTNIISAVNVLLNAVFAAVLLLLGWDLRGLVYGYIGSAIFTMACYLVIVRRLLPRISVNPVRFDVHEARKMFGYSLKLYVTQAAVVVHNQVEKVYLATFVGVAPAGWYDIASDVALKVRGSISFILAPMLPAASELDALGDELRMKELYYRSHKYLALCGVPLVCFVGAVSPLFVVLWIGPNMRMIALPLSVLLAANYFNLATGPGFLILAGRRDMEPGMRSATLGIVLNVILSVVLIYKFGFAGAVVGTSMSLLVASSYFVYVFHSRTGYSFRRVLRESYVKPICCSLAGWCVILSLKRTISSSGWQGLIEAAVGFGIFYCVAILLCRFLDEYDWIKIRSLIPLAKHAKRAGLVA